MQNSSHYGTCVFVHQPPSPEVLYVFRLLAHPFTEGRIYNTGMLLILRRALAVFTSSLLFSQSFGALPAASLASDHGMRIRFDEVACAPPAEAVQKPLEGPRGAMGRIGISRRVFLFGSGAAAVAAAAPSPVSQVWHQGKNLLQWFNVLRHKLEDRQLPDYERTIEISQREAREQTSRLAQSDPAWDQIGLYFSRLLAYLSVDSNAYPKTVQAMNQFVLMNRGWLLVPGDDWQLTLVKTSMERDFLAVNDDSLFPRSKVIRVWNGTRIYSLKKDDPAADEPVVVFGAANDLNLFIDSNNFDEFKENFLDLLNPKSTFSIAINPDLRQLLLLALLRDGWIVPQGGDLNTCKWNGDTADVHYMHMLIQRGAAQALHSFSEEARGKIEDIRTIGYVGQTAGNQSYAPLAALILQFLHEEESADPDLKKATQAVAKRMTKTNEGVRIASRIGRGDLTAFSELLQRALTTEPGPLHEAMVNARKDQLTKAPFQWTVYGHLPRHVNAELNVSHFVLYASLGYFGLLIGKRTHFLYRVKKASRKGETLFIPGMTPSKDHSLTPNAKDLTITYAAAKKAYDLRTKRVRIVLAIFLAVSLGWLLFTTHVWKSLTHPTIHILAPPLRTNHRSTYVAA